MKSQFDKIVDRRGTGALKTDVIKETFGKEDLIPLWIADMDFETPDVVRKAVEERLKHQIYGYTGAQAGYWQSIIQWERDINDWKIKREHLAYIPGIVRGITFAIHCFTSPGDLVMVQPPVYMPFMNLVKNNGRRLVFNPLKFAGGNYEMNLDEMESICSELKPKMFILCNPHNPSGRVWSAETLAKVADICCRHNVLVISDEIHGDMPLFGHRYTPFQKVSDTAADISICFKAPSKTFNIAGFASSHCIVPNPRIRKTFFDYMEANELDSPLFISAVATEAAYKGARKWREEMLEYVEENVNFVEDYLREHMPLLSIVRPQASFLIWLNCSKLALDHDSLVSLFIDKAGLALNDGEAFGPGGEGFMRMNVGCPRSVLEKALGQLEKALEK